MEMELGSRKKFGYSKVQKRTLLLLSDGVWKGVRFRLSRVESMSNNDVNI